jgi:UDP-2,4-diacetamido-2,4,6-trideoxy-beta-L-altropyranose hydrolase
MRIAIRVDASASLGLGHLKRCLALADAMSVVGAEVLFLSARSNVDVAAFVTHAGFSCCELDSPLAEVGGAQGHRNPVMLDAQHSIDALRAWRPSWVVIDHYGLDVAWHERVSLELGTRTAVIDDLADRLLAAEVVVDPNFSTDYQKKFGSIIDRSVQLLAGPRFALLGASYASATRYAFREEVKSIGIFMGGTDPSNVSPIALAACREAAGFMGPIEIVTTSANLHIAELRAACARWQNTSLLVGLENLSEFFARHDLQIGAGGGATWERCCIGAPTLALVCADNQKVVVPALAERGVVATCEEISSKSIGDAVARLLDAAEERKQLSERALTMVDGMGARRVALVLTRELLRVRPAGKADARVMFEWRNDSVIRRTARDSSMIAWSDHVAWVEQSLNMEDRLLMMAQIGRTPVGVIRFDRRQGEAEVSLYLDPQLHGLGLGHLVLQQGETAAASHWPALGGFVAETLTHNIGSQRLFIGAGYSGNHSRFYKTKGVVCRY